MHQRWSMPSRPWSRVLLLLVVLAAAPAAAAPTPTLSPRPTPRGTVICTGAIQHPIEVRVSALDLVRRGASLRVQVRASAVAEVEDAQVRLVSPGGAAVRGAAVARLGRLAPGMTRSAEFQVELPVAARRTLLQFQVTGQGPTGPLTRGATLNLLPDGPADAGRAIVTPNGAHVIEFGARRIDL